MDIPKLFDLKSSQFLVCTREIEADKARCLWDAFPASASSIFFCLPSAGHSTHHLTTCPSCWCNPIARCIKKRVPIGIW
jgi:hypothetical protein